MELFKGAKAVRLRSHHDKYLVAEEDEEHVSQDRSGSAPGARWTVDLPDAVDAPVLRLKSCYGRYLTASNEPFLLGMTGRKVLQTLPRRLDSSVEWEPIREGFQVKLKTRYGHFLRANGGLPPWRNSITHDIPHRTATQDWVLWDVDIVDLHVHRSPAHPAPPAPASSSSSTTPDKASDSSPGSTPSMSPRLSRKEASSSLPGSPHKTDGRTIYCSIADDRGNVDDGIEGHSFIFKGTNLSQLTEKLEEETGLSDIIVCSRNPLNGKLHPLLLHLPPNNAAMHVVVVQASSRGEFACFLRRPLRGCLACRTAVSLDPLPEEVITVNYYF